MVSIINYYSSRLVVGNSFIMCIIAIWGIFKPSTFDGIMPSPRNAWMISDVPHHDPEDSIKCRRIPIRFFEEFYSPTAIFATARRTVVSKTD